MKYTRRIAFSIVVGVCCGGVSDAMAQASLEGTYTLSVGGSDDIATSIENAVAKMNFIKRPIARGRLKKTNPAYQRIVISRTPAQIAVTFDERAPIQMPANGVAVKWQRDDGEIFDVSAGWSPPNLTQKFKAEDGQRTNTFRLSADGGELVLDVVIDSDQLTAPMTYSLIYRRASA